MTFPNASSTARAASAELADAAPHATTNVPRAALHMLTAALLFAVMSALVKVASQALPSAMVVFLRCALSLLLLVPLAASRGSLSLRTAHLREHLLRGVVGMGGMYCFFFTISKLGLAEALLVNYSLPLFIPLVERAWLGEPTPRGIGRPLAIGMCGLCFILKPGTGIFQPAALVGVLGALFAATAQVGVRGLTRTESITKIVLYFGLISTLVSALPAAFAWVTPRPELWLLLAGLVLSATLAQLAMTRAYHLAPAAQVGPFIYASVAFAALFDWLWFERHPDAFSVCGTGLVIAAGVLTLRGAREKTRAAI